VARDGISESSFGEISVEHDVRPLPAAHFPANAITAQNALEPAHGEGPIHRNPLSQDKILGLLVFSCFNIFDDWGRLPKAIDVDHQNPFGNIDTSRILPKELPVGRGEKVGQILMLQRCL
jgi:hypothetical protein